MLVKIESVKVVNDNHFTYLVNQKGAILWIAPSQFIDCGITENIFTISNTEIDNHITFDLKTGVCYQDLHPYQLTLEGGKPLSKVIDHVKALKEYEAKNPDGIKLSSYRI